MRMRWILGVAVASAACGGGAGGSDAPHRFDNPKKALAFAVSQEMTCLGDEVEYTPEPGPKGATRYHVKGCGQRAIFLVKDGVGAIEAPASESKHVRQIAMKASFKWACNPAKISVTPTEKDRPFGGTILPTRALVKGCDREAFYVYSSSMRGFEEARPGE